MKKNIMMFLLCSAILPCYTFAEEKQTSQDKVLATYKGGELKESQVINAVNLIPQAQSILKDKKFSELDKQIQQDLIKACIRKILLDQAASNSNIDKSEEFKKREAEVKKQMIFQEYLSQYWKKNITESLIDEEYRNIVHQLTGKKEIKVWHILVDSEDAAKDVKKQLEAGKKFATLAKKYSTDEATKNVEGLLGFIREGSTIPEFEQAAFNSSPGKISAPIKTTYGWHIIKTGEKRNVVIPTKEQAKAETTRIVQQQLLNKLIDDLYQKADVKILSN